MAQVKSCVRFKNNFFSCNKDELKLPEVEAGILASWECLLKAHTVLNFSTENQGEPSQGEKSETKPMA